tara:strand:- start:1466 stop:2056 length:591 start_codon:yes stop_codon:yes gene_type:complete
MARINQAKLQGLLDHLQLGGATDKATLAKSIGATARTQDATINNYLEAIDDELDENLVGLQIGGENPYRDEDEEVEQEEEEQEEESEEEEEEQEETPAPQPAPKKKEPKPAKADKEGDFKFYLERQDGTAVQIFQRKKKGKIISFYEKVPTQIVTLMLKGNVVEVDLITLRIADGLAVSEYGITNERLLALAIAAQ